MPTLRIEYKEGMPKITHIESGADLTGAFTKIQINMLPGEIPRAILETFAVETDIEADCIFTKGD